MSEPAGAWNADAWIKTLPKNERDYILYLRGDWVAEESQCIPDGGGLCRTHPVCELSKPTWAKLTAERDALQTRMDKPNVTIRNTIFDAAKEESGD